MIFTQYPVNEFEIIPLFTCNNGKKLHSFVGKNRSNIEIFTQIYKKQFECIIFSTLPQDKFMLLKNLWQERIRYRSLETIETILESLLNQEYAVSDIHFFPKTNGVTVKYRQQGMLYVLGTMPEDQYLLGINKMKAIAKLDIFKKTTPQSGSMSLFLQGKLVFLRISFHPSISGEKLAIRMLNTVESMETMEDLGITSQDAYILRQMTEKTGMIIAAGATGSGKTTTSYVLLKEILRKNVNIITVEDPIEFFVEGFCQTSVSEISYGEAIKSALRQDVDVLFVGEIRDEETAKYALRGAMTGHLVITTMHLSSANQAINRLKDLGADINFIKHHLIGVFVQKLVWDKNIMKPHIKFWINEFFEEEAVGV